MPISAFSVVSPRGSVPDTGYWLQKPTGVPSRSAADTAFAAARSTRWRFCALAQRSTAKRPLTSVAVEMAAWPPVRAAIRRAKSLPPPTWPERSGTAKCPASSTDTTAGSVNLSFTKGAMARTAIPAAEMNTNASLSKNRAAVHAARSAAGRRSASESRAVV